MYQQYYVKKVCVCDVYLPVQSSAKPHLGRLRYLSWPAFHDSTDSGNGHDGPSGGQTSPNGPSGGQPSPNGHGGAGECS